MADSEFLAPPERGFFQLERLATRLNCLYSPCKPEGPGSPVVVTPLQSAAAGCSFGSRRESMKRTWERFILFAMLALGLVLLGYGVLLELGLA
jgi:hypothetical protein